MEQQFGAFQLMNIFILQSPAKSWNYQVPIQFGSDYELHSGIYHVDKRVISGEKCELCSSNWLSFQILFMFDKLLLKYLLII